MRRSNRQGTSRRTKTQRHPSATRRENQIRFAYGARMDWYEDDWARISERIRRGESIRAILF